MTFSTETLQWHGYFTIVVRDGKTGEVLRTEKTCNQLLSVTFPVIGCILFNNPANFALTFNKLALGQDSAVTSGDTGLGSPTFSRTIGRFSQNLCGPPFNLSWSITNLPASVSLQEAGVFFSLTGGKAFLKATYATVTVASQNVIQATWLMSFQSAG